MAKARPITGLDAQAPVANNARLIARARLDDFYQWEAFVDNPYYIRELHDLRIAAKRLRYTFEIFEEVLPDVCRAFAVELTQIQDELGALHDSDVLIALLRLCLANQDSAAVSQSGRLKQHAGKRLVTPDMASYILRASTAPTIEQRYGLESLLQKQEQERERRYAAFRQHWYRLKARDFRREMLDALGA
jgi:hypothetical protein